ncbi:MAG: hypothetical protein U0L49_11625 [Eubacterium sp.]|nr:hypothetical protein [Eubacterium sp.]
MNTSTRAARNRYYNNRNRKASADERALRKANEEWFSEKEYGKNPVKSDMKATLPIVAAWVALIAVCI